MAAVHIFFKKIFLSTKKCEKYFKSELKQRGAAPDHSTSGCSRPPSTRPGRSSPQVRSIVLQSLGTSAQPLELSCH